jgi:hypothetical protein
MRAELCSVLFQWFGSAFWADMINQTLDWGARWLLMRRGAFIKIYISALGVWSWRLKGDNKTGDCGNGIWI